MSLLRLESEKELKEELNEVSNPWNMSPEHLGREPADMLCFSLSGKTSRGGVCVCVCVCVCRCKHKLQRGGAIANL